MKKANAIVDWNCSGCLRIRFKTRFTTEKKSGGTRSYTIIVTNQWREILPAHHNFEKQKRKNKINHSCLEIRFAFHQVVVMRCVMTPDPVISNLRNEELGNNLNHWIKLKRKTWSSSASSLIGLVFKPVMSEIRRVRRFNNGCNPSGSQAVLEVRTLETSCPTPVLPCTIDRANCIQFNRFSNHIHLLFFYRNRVTKGLANCLIVSISSSLRTSWKE